MVERPQTFGASKMKFIVRCADLGVNKKLFEKVGVSKEK